MNKICPPCTGDCTQGRQCPAAIDEAPDWDLIEIGIYWIGATSWIALLAVFVGIIVGFYFKG